MEVGEAKTSSVQTARGPCSSAVCCFLPSGLCFNASVLPENAEQPVVTKVLAASYSRAPQSLARFEREAKALAK